MENDALGEQICALAEDLKGTIEPNRRANHILKLLVYGDKKRDTRQECPANR